MIAWRLTNSTTSCAFSTRRMVLYKAASADHWIAMGDPISCPYCTEGDRFKVMTERDGGVWFRCSQCGHIVMPEERLFKCSCLKCFDLRSSTSVFQKPPRN